MVPIESRGKGRDRTMATSLQRGASAFQSRLPDTRRVRGKDQGARRSVPAGDGPECCDMWGLRAPPRRITAPQGAIASSSKRSGRLKLKVVRRKWAGHDPGKYGLMGSSRNHKRSISTTCLNACRSKNAYTGTAVSRRGRLLHLGACRLTMSAIWPRRGPGHARADDAWCDRGAVTR